MDTQIKEELDMTSSAQDTQFSFIDVAAEDFDNHNDAEVNEELGDPLEFSIKKEFKMEDIEEENTVIDGHSIKNDIFEEDSLEILYNEELKTEKVEQQGENDEKFNDANNQMTATDQVECCLCSELVQATDNNFKKQLKVCDSCYETNKNQFKSQWLLDKCKLYKSCMICLNGFLNNLSVFKHNCTCENTFWCNLCDVMYDRKIDIVKHMSLSNQFNVHTSDSHNILNCNLLGSLDLTGENSEYNFSEQTGAVTANNLLSSEFCTLYENINKIKIIKTDTKTHLRVNSGKRRYDCKQCHKSFTSSHSLKTHLLIHSGEKPHICKHCDKSFCHLGNLKSHLRIHSGDKPYNCKHCDKSFYQLGTLKNHLRIHSGDKPYSCKHCDKAFTQSQQLKSHLRIHSGDKPYSCKQCDQVFTRSQHLKRHLRIHSGDKPYSCKHCDKSFSELGNLKCHLRIHSGDKRFSCEHCSKSFTLLGNLKNHLRIHSGEKPYSCKHCDRSFTTLGNLKSHLRIHSGDKPYCEHCNKSFSQSQYLKIHLRIHSGEKPYSCKHCDKSFSQLGHLNCHLRIHSGDEPYSCKHCDKAFTQPQYLKRHLRIHSGDKPYSC